MRDTTGIPSDGSTGGLVVYEMGGREFLSVPIPEDLDRLNVVDVLQLAAIDPVRLRQAAEDACIGQGEEHAARIWAMYKQIMDTLV
jgi:hypothetical protein